MKKIAILCGVIAALLCLSQSASAQYARKGANLVDRSGAVLTDQQVISLVGNDVFEETFVGARKQYKSGKTLIWSGIAGMVVGTAGAVFTAIKLQDAGYNDVNINSYEDLKQIIEKDPSIAALYLGSSAIGSLGATALSAGIVLKVIGKKRLNWVEEQANGQYGMALGLGATPSGFGVTLTF